MNNKIELLSPAGDMDALKAAVQNGADAVYLGGRLFNARRYAKNFGYEELINAIDYAHERDVKVYLTMNTLVDDSEIKQAVDFAEFIYREGIDAVIVQDLGLAGIINRTVPSLRLHGSTQMTLHNSYGAAKASELGINRVVLARELSIDEINTIRNNTELEIEVFVHGALCICYSGQCLLSSMIGGRSGNRGSCAQPCRLPWELVCGNENKSSENREYLLSPKDLCALSSLPEIVKAGVHSLKIEGRMKSPEYVAIVTRIYRKYLNLYLGGISTDSGPTVSDEDYNELVQIFSRGGFSKGYLKGKSSGELVYSMYPKHQGVYLGRIKDYSFPYIELSLEKEAEIGDGIEIHDGRGIKSIIISSILLNGRHISSAGRGRSVQIGDVRIPISPGSEVYRTMKIGQIRAANKSYMHGESIKVPINCEMTIQTGEYPVISFYDRLGNKAFVKGDKAVQEAINKSIDPDRVEKQIKKTGDSPYEVTDVRIKYDGDAALPISEINALRRSALTELSRIRIRNCKRDLKSSTHISTDFPGNIEKFIEKKLSLYFHREADFSKWDKTTGVGRVYVRFNQSLSGIEKLRDQGVEIFIWTPVIIKDNEMTYVLSQIADKLGIIDGIAGANLGLMHKLGINGIKINKTADSGFNIYNSYTVRRLYALGINDFVLSPELNIKQIGDINPSGGKLEVSVFGYLPVMTSEYCVLHKGVKCGVCKSEDYFLKDRKGCRFPVITDRKTCRMTVFNSKRLVFEELHSLPSVKYFRINILDETPDEIEKILEIYKERLKNGCKSSDKNDIIDLLGNGGYTKGYFYRGVG